MERRRLARFGLVLGLAGLFGCAPLPQPQVAVAPTPVAVPAPPPAPPMPVPPAPVALVPAAPPPAAVVPPPAGPVIATHPMVHHRHWVRRYAAQGINYYGPACGSVAHPCSVYHTVVPIQ